MVRIHRLLSVLCDRRLERWRLADDQEAVFSDRLTARVLEGLFIDCKRTETDGYPENRRRQRRCQGSVNNERARCT